MSSVSSLLIPSNHTLTIHPFPSSGLPTLLISYLPWLPPPFASLSQYHLLFLLKPYNYIWADICKRHTRPCFSWSTWCDLRPSSSSSLQWNLRPSHGSQLVPHSSSILVSHAASQKMAAAAQSSTADGVLFSVLSLFCFIVSYLINFNFRSSYCLRRYLLLLLSSGHE